MPNFMLLLHEHPEDYAPLSPDEMQAIVESYRAWSQALGAAGKLLSGDKLTDDAGRHLTRNAGGSVMVTDGPYAEAAEVIGGLFVVKAADYAEAQAIAETCPHLHGRNRIEIRQVEFT